MLKTTTPMIPHYLPLVFCDDWVAEITNCAFSADLTLSFMACWRVFQLSVLVYSNLIVCCSLTVLISLISTSGRQLFGITKVCMPKQATWNKIPQMNANTALCFICGKHSNHWLPFLKLLFSGFVAEARYLWHKWSHQHWQGQCRFRMKSTGLHETTAAHSIF